MENFHNFHKCSRKTFSKSISQKSPKNNHKGLIYYSFMTTPTKRDSNEDYQQKPYSIPNILLNYHYLTHFYISILLISCREPKSAVGADRIPRRRTRTTSLLSAPCPPSRYAPSRYAHRFPTMEVVRIFIEN